MIFDSLILTAVTEELNTTIAGGKVERITQPEPLEIVLRLYRDAAKHDLLLNCAPESARVHLTWIRRENPPQPPAFCMLLRKYLEGARLHAITMPLGFGERVLHLEFRSYDGAPCTLIAEIMGKHSNLILVSGGGMILGSAKQITKEISRFREVLPGRSYAPPPRQFGKWNPFSAFSADSAEPLPTLEDAQQWLSKTFTGVSPLLAAEAVRRAEPPWTPEALWQGLDAALAAVRAGAYSPRIWSDDYGVTQGAYPIPLRSVPPANQYERNSISLALDNAAASIDQRSSFQHLRDALQAALHRTRKARQREQEEVERGLGNAARAQEYQEMGDLLKANLHAVSRGDAQAAVTDYYQTADSDGRLPLRTIPLDPTLDPLENAERYYRRARKAQAGLEALQERAVRLGEEIALLIRAESDAAQAVKASEVEAIHERVAGLLMQSKQAPPGNSAAGVARPPSFEGHKIKTFRSVDGWEILVGESATANDYLTTKVAGPSDIWLHVRAATSAHGIIRAQNRPASVSAAAIRHAAELVAARSEVKHSSLIPVDYTLKKYVRKPRKSAPGSVVYEREKTIYVGGIHEQP